MTVQLFAATLSGVTVYAHASGHIGLELSVPDRAVGACANLTTTQAVEVVKLLTDALKAQFVAEVTS